MAGASSSAAAAEAARRRRIEEEEMTNYSREDLANDWEFKIVRSLTATFRNPAVLEKCRQEEARAGWVMVEKFDNSRVRFKRLVRARDNDSRLPPGVDPYRTYYGVGYVAFTTTVILITLAAMGVVFGCIMLIPLLESFAVLH
jgi:hypothetical protein